MKPRLIFFLVGAALLALYPARGHGPKVWDLVSPNHEQTFAYGSESQRQWAARGTPGHLLLYLGYTNDPYVDRSNPRQYDNFSFDFPSVQLQPDGRTFAYRTPDGGLVPVARRKSGFLGIEEIDLLPTSELIIRQPHGSLTVLLRVVE